MANKVWFGNDSGNVGDLDVAANWIPSGVPASGDDVRFPAGSAAITANVDALNNSTLSGALASVIFEDGYNGAVGSSGAPMQFSCTRFEYHGSGIAFIDLEASAIPPQIFKTANSTAAGFFGLTLTGSALTIINVWGGNLAIAPSILQTSTVGTVRAMGSNARVFVGAGVTLTNYYQTAGSGQVNCAGTTLTAYGGSVLTRGVGAWTTINARGANITPESTGTITNLNADAGSVDFTKSGAARTVANLKVNPGATVSYDPAVLTVTTRVAPDFPIRVAATRPN